MFEVKENLTRENVTSRIDEYSIFRAYCTNFKDIDIAFNSELRDDQFLLVV